MPLDAGIPLKRVASKPFVAYISRSRWAPLRAFRRCQYKYRDYLGEFMATLVFLILGLAVNAQYTLWSKATDSFAACYGWGFAIVCGVYVGRRISSAHLNPAVTLSLYLFRGFPGRKVAGYCVAQLLGAFLATAVVYGCFRSGLDKFDGGIRQWQGEQATSNIFYVHPRPEVSFANHFLSEFVGSCILMIVICAVSDRHNNHDSDIVLPISLGFTVASVLLSLGYSTGLSINPARDIGPRLFGLCVYGSSAFSNNHYYFWVPTVAAFVGAPAGCLLYDLFVPSTPLGEEYADAGDHSPSSSVQLQPVAAGSRELLPTTMASMEKTTP